MGLVYLIRCKINNKVYIGQTINSLRSRWNGHTSSARYHKDYLNGDKEAPHNKHGTCSKLYRAMNKHGIENFSIEILEEEYNDDSDLLNMMEEQYITEFNSVAEGYNLKAGGNSSKHSDETKALLKIKNSENMKTTFKQFRKHDIIADLPMYCIYIKKAKTEGVAINKHPLCARKEFTISKYNTMQDAKIALMEYLNALEASGVEKEKFIKKDIDLPKGVRKIKNSYFVDKTVKGQTFRKAFSGQTDEENKNNAINYINMLIG